MGFLGIDWNWDKSIAKKAIDAIANGWVHNNSGTLSSIPKLYDSVPDQVAAGSNEYWDRYANGGATPTADASGQSNPNQSLTDWVSFDPNGGSSGGYSAAAALRSMLQQIDDSYNRQRGALDQNKATSLGNINSAMDRYKQQIAANYSDYQGQAGATQQAIAQRIADQQAAAAQRSTALQDSVGSIGGTNSAAIQAQAQGLSDALKASGGFQQDLSNRLAQVVANNQRQYQNTGDLIRQGATGTLENNYNAMLNALMSSIEQQRAQAQQSASGGGGGGGSSSSTDYSKYAKNLAAKNAIEWAVNGYQPTADELALNSLLGGDANTYLTYLTSQKQSNNGN